MSSSSQGSLNDVQKELLSELSTLDRVSHKLAMTEAGLPLQKVLNLLLPRLLRRIGSNNSKSAEFSRDFGGSSELEKSIQRSFDDIHRKVVEILSHILKRCKADQSCQLPCDSILELLYNKETHSAINPDQVNPFSLNLSITFLTIGLPRCPANELKIIFAALLSVLGVYYNEKSIASASRKMQLYQISHLVLRCIEGIMRSRKMTRQSSISDSTPSSIVIPTERNEIDVPDFLLQAKALCKSNENVSVALYDLLLDVLLYQINSTSDKSDIPPTGLSKFGNERLLSGNSITAQNWKLEQAKGSALKDLKYLILEFVAPCRYDAFDMSGMIRESSVNPLVASRVVSLLVVANGDQHMDVADRAASYLKAYIDLRKNIRFDSQHDERNRNQHDQRNRNESVTNIMLGDPILLLSELMTLTLGDIVTARAMIVIPKCTNIKTRRLKLGLETHHFDRAVAMSMNRRMISEKNASTILRFIATYIFEDIPSVFNFSYTHLGDDSNFIAESSYNASIAFTLVVMCSNKFAGSGNSLSGMSTTSSIGNVSVDSMKLLNLACIRVVALFDAFYKSMKKNSKLSTSLVQLENLLSKAFINACNIVSVASSKGSGNTLDSIGIEARDHGYGIICTISRSSLFSHNKHIILNCGEIPKCDIESIPIKTATLLFGCVTNETDRLRPRAVAALDSLLGSYMSLLSHDYIETIQNDSKTENPWLDDSLQKSDERKSNINMEKLAKSLVLLLWNASRSTQAKTCRHVAARWTVSLLKKLDILSACHLLCFLSGDVDVATSTVARDGLGLTNQLGLEIKLDSSQCFPDFGIFIRTVVVGSAKSSGGVWCPTFNDFTASGKAACLRFAQLCLLSDMYVCDKDAIIVFIQALSKILNASEGNDYSKQDMYILIDEAAICFSSLLNNSSSARQSIITEELCSSLSLQRLPKLALISSSSKARRYLAESLGHILEDNVMWSTQSEADVDFWIDRTQVEDILTACFSEIRAVDSPSASVKELHGAIYVASTTIRALRFYACTLETNRLREALRNASRVLEFIVRGTLHTNEVIANACSSGLFIAYQYKQTDAPILPKSLTNGTFAVLSTLCTAMKKFGTGNDADPARVACLIEAAGNVLAASTVYQEDTTYFQNDIGRVRLECVYTLFDLLGSMSNRKDPELSLAIGAALAMYADAYSPEGCKWSSPQSITQEIFSQEYANELPPHEQVLYIVLKREIMNSSPHKRTSCAPVLLALVGGRVARSVNRDTSILGTRLFAKTVLHQLNNIQRAFIELLGDPKSKQLIRESCQLGLAACYTISKVQLDHKQTPFIENEFSTNLTDNLLRAFGQTTNYGTSAFMETTEQNARRTGTSLTNGTTDSEVEVGGVAGLGEAALGAFREMASAAVAVHQPSILYSLLILSTSLPIWQLHPEYSAESLLGQSIHGIHEIRSMMKPYMKKLIPRLLRACNDPNKQASEQITSLWRSLSGGGQMSRDMIDEHLLHVLDELIHDSASKFWRARFGACKALSEIIIGRSWEELGGGGPVDCSDINNIEKSAGVRLLLLFRVTVRALDDVRLAVREAGGVLSRSLISLTVRLCNPLLDSEKEDNPYLLNENENSQSRITSAQASETCLPWIVKYGLNQTCSEAVGFSISCLLKIVEVAHAETLEAVLPDLVESLLMSMSGLEPAVLNYIQVRVAGHDAVASDRLEQMRLQMVSSGPFADSLNKCLDILTRSSLKSQQLVIPRLDSALRMGIGFATRSAAADAVSSLCSASPSAFKFNVNLTANPTSRLLRALYFASEREKGSYARGKMIHALGNLAALAPGSTVRSLARKLCERYKHATGSHDDLSIRRVAAAALKAIATRASNQFSDGGSGDIWRRRILPLSFIAQNDPDVGSDFAEVWQEGGYAIKKVDDASIHTEEIILLFLSREIIEALDDVSWSRRRVACVSLMKLVDGNILAPSLQSLDSADVSGDVIQLAKTKAQATCRILTSCVNLIVKTRVWAGKEDLVRTVATITSKWCGPEFETTNTAHFLGFEGKIEDCPWTPINLDGAELDLFTGDQWFSSHKVDAIGKEENAYELCSQESYQKENEPEDGIIDFGLADIEEFDDVMKNSTHKDEEFKIISLFGLCRLLIEQGLPENGPRTRFSPEYLSYRAASIESLSTILDRIQRQSFNLYDLISPSILSIVHNELITDESIPPLIVAKSVGVLSSIIWQGIGDTEYGTSQAQLLCDIFLYHSSYNQHAWTVREQASLAFAKLIDRGHFSVIKRLDTIQKALDATKQCQQDRKFWRVRLGGLMILKSLTGRVERSKAILALGSTTQTALSSSESERQILLESVLPFKESITDIVKSCLTDSEAQVAKLASDILASISFWP